MAEMDKNWKLLDSELVLDTPWYRIRKDKVKLPSGVIIDDYYVSELPNVVLVFPITPKNEVIMVRQYRHPVQTILTELPAGTFNRNEENAQAAARRELLDETGYSSPHKLEFLGSVFEYPTKDSHKISLFLARDVAKTAEPNFEDTEDIEVIKAPLNQTLEMVYRNEIQVSGSIVAILLATHKLGLDH